MNNLKPKAIALCRVSTKQQEEDGNLKPQEDNVEKAAEVIGAELVRTWALAVSSRKGKNVKRKDLREMHDYCKRYKSVKYLIVDEVDRFMRSIQEYYWWKMEFQIIGVRLILADRPDIDPDDDRAVFDELIDVYRAEQSNNERIKKTPGKMMAKIRAGYYPSNPHTGYKISDVPGLHVPDEPNWSAMRNAFKAMAAGEIDVKKGLRQATEDGLRTKNYGPKSVGGKTIDMFRWKALMSDPYFCGVLFLSDWEERNENGLHVPMITPEEHAILVQLVKNKGKRFVINRNNPEFPFSNEAECTRCILANNPYPRLVGYWQNNGQKKGYKRYRRYRCRDCSLGIRQEAFHSEVSNELEQLILTFDQKEKLKAHCRSMWSSYEKVRIERARIALGKVQILKDKKSELISSLAANQDIADDIKQEIEAIKIRIMEAEHVANKAQDFERDFDEFIGFAFDFLEDLKAKWWDLDKDTMKMCKQILFPSGIQLTPDKKVYIPEISLVYRYADNKKAPEGADFTKVEGPVGFEPTTRGLKVHCSNLLSYGPKRRMEKCATFLSAPSIRLRPGYDSRLPLFSQDHAKG